MLHVDRINALVFCPLSTMLDAANLGGGISHQEQEDSGKQDEPCRG